MLLIFMRGAASEAYSHHREHSLKLRRSAVPNIVIQSPACMTQKTACPLHYSIPLIRGWSQNRGKRQNRNYKRLMTLLIACLLPYSMPMTRGGIRTETKVRP